MTVRRNPLLPADNAEGEGVEVQWADSNEQWWDWYLSLAAGSSDDGPLVDVPQPDPGPLPSDAAVRAELRSPYPLSGAQVAAFRAESFVKLPGVLSPGAVVRLGTALTAALRDSPHAQRAASFQSLEMMWLTDPFLRAYVLSPRLGRLAADLLGVRDVRLYHDNALSKVPGCGRTPWHYDDHHFPIDTTEVVTAWIPVQETPRAMGPLSFARGIDTWKLVADVPFDKHGTTYDTGVSSRFREADVVVEDGGFAIGEVSFHHSLCFHTAGPNRTTTPRSVLATTYFVDGGRLVESPTMISGDWEKFLPGARPGEPITTAYNPICSHVE